MRNLSLLLLLLVCLSSCRDDFELDAPYQDIPVVFAYLDINEDDNFVRIQKAFLGTNGSATSAANNIDSLYYNENEATVTLTVGNNDPVALEQVNGDDFGIARDTGFFINTPNILYRIPDFVELNGGNEIQLTVSRPGEEDAVATTTMLSELTMSFPRSDEGIRLFNYNTFTNIRWMTNPAARVYDVRMFINIREFDTNNPDNNRDRTLVWNIARAYEPDEDGTTASFVMPNENFWQFLGSALDADPNIIRNFQNMEVTVTAVGQEVEDALNLSNANAGITSAQSIPIYTNVENGLGIFTSRTSGGATNISLEAQNTDTLRNGIYTFDLNFQ